MAFDEESTKRLYHRAISKWGGIAQLMMLSEECVECALAVRVGRGQPVRPAAGAHCRRARQHHSNTERKERIMREDLKKFAYLVLLVEQQRVVGVDVVPNWTPDTSDMVLVETAYALEYPSARYKLLPKARELAALLTVKARCS